MGDESKIIFTGSGICSKILKENRQLSFFEAAGKEFGYENPYDVEFTSLSFEIYENPISTFFGHHVDFFASGGA